MRVLTRHQRPCARILPMPHLMISLLLLALLAGCSEVPAETALRQQLQAIQEGIEEKQPGDVVELIAEEFATAKGQDKRWIQRTLTLQMLRKEKINILLSQINVSIHDPKNASATFNAVVTGGQGLIPDEGAIYRVTTNWRIYDNEWQLIYAEWDKL